ncbi:MAG: 2-C-methyl-D-erythritol 4-phosphate cytidylyltransferase [Candidatus Omnitrophota bacterium]|nr:2-C-methyl-D-erythritol 4-phosphate cytidylyltransferase [Candidatus Omnitrophota bacterium]
MSSALSMNIKCSGRKSGVRRPSVIAIVPAAGYGNRLGAGKKKPLVFLRKKPIVSYALKALNDCPLVDAIIVASEKALVKDFWGLTGKYGFKKIIDVVVGGKTRQESVSNCIKAISSSYDIVLIHDAARPLIDRTTIKKSIDLAKKFGACIVAVPENDTIKLADKGLFVKKTLDRKKIFRAQTPQAFRYDIIKKAYRVFKRPGKYTDDAGLVEKLGVKIKIFEGPRRNIKITTKEDLKLAEVLL